jgi:hypothetical protein
MALTSPLTIAAYNGLEKSHDACFGRTIMGAPAQPGPETDAILMTALLHLEGLVSSKSSV